MTLLDIEQPPVSHRSSQTELLKNAGSVSPGVTISPEMFEQMFFAPKTEVKGDLRPTFGNPTAISVAGFLLCTTPLSMALLGWQGSDMVGVATVGSYFWFGGLLLVLGGIGEWILGNTFPATVFLTFAGFFLTFGSTLTPSYNAYGAYGLEASDVASSIGNITKFHSTFAFFLVAMTLLCTVYCIASIRTNITFFLIFLLLIPTFSTLSASHFALGHGNIAAGQRLQNVGAGLLLAISLIGWYQFLALILLSVDFPFTLPLGDLSTRVPSHTEEQQKRSKKT